MYSHQNIKKKTRDGQHRPTGRPHNSLRTHLRAALVYAYIERGGGGNSLESGYLKTLSYATVMVECQGGRLYFLHSTQRYVGLLCVLLEVMSCSL